MAAMDHGIDICEWLRTRCGLDLDRVTHVTIQFPLNDPVSVTVQYQATDGTVKSVMRELAVLPIKQEPVKDGKWK